MNFDKSAPSLCRREAPARFCRIDLLNITGVTARFRRRGPNTELAFQSRAESAGPPPHEGATSMTVMRHRLTGSTLHEGKRVEGPGSVGVNSSLNPDHLSLSCKKIASKDPVTMSLARTALVVAILCVLLGAALGQATAPPSPASETDDVSEWTSRQWNRAKAQWEQEKRKWADCQKQSKEQNLIGRKSWPFLASCMMPATSSKIDDVSQWTSKQWNRAKAEWEKEKQKWARCRKQSKDQNLSGRESWSFFASCMNS